MCLKHVLSAVCPVTFTSGWNCDPEGGLLVRDEAGHPLWLLLRVEFRCADSDNPSWKLAKDAKVNCFWVKWCNISNDQRDLALFPLNIPLNHRGDFYTVLRFARKGKGRTPLLVSKGSGGAERRHFSQNLDMWHTCTSPAISCQQCRCSLLAFPFPSVLGGLTEARFSPVTAFVPQLRSAVPCSCPAPSAPGELRRDILAWRRWESSRWHRAGRGGLLISLHWKHFK